MTELIATLKDAAHHGDWRGHLRVWWEVATGRVAAG